MIQTAGSTYVFLKGISYLTLAYIIREDERGYLSNSNGISKHFSVLILLRYLFLESIPYLVGLLHESTNSSDRRSNGLEARELCKGLSKLSVANDNKHKVRPNYLILYFSYKTNFFLDLFGIEITRQSIEYARTTFK